MQRVSIGSGLFVGAVTSIGAIAILELGAAAWGFPFAPFAIFELVTRSLPGSLVTVGIDAMVSLISALGIRPTSVAAKVTEQAMAVLMFVAGSAVLGAIVAFVSRGRSRSALVCGVAAGVVWLAAALAAQRGASGGDIVWTAAVLLGWGLLVGQLVAARAVLRDRNTLARAARGSRR